MQKIYRLSLYALVGLAALRAAFFFIYARYQLPSPLETYPIEAEMVHLAWRVQSGLSLYPPWETYPHVSNFFVPLYFWCLGWLGKAFDADLRDLFLIGRAITVSANFLTTLSLGTFLHRRYGGPAALAGSIVSLGASPLFGFAVMARADVMADFFGIAGFLLSIQRKRAIVLLGAALLVAACLSKQSAGMYLVASLTACWLDPSRRRMGWLLTGWTAALLVSVIVPLQFYEPSSLRSWFEESRTPLAWSQWLAAIQYLLTSSPDLLVISAAGTIAWIRSRETALAVLAIAVLGVSLATAAKLGSDLNYFLGLRSVEALALGKLWHSAAALNGGVGKLAAALSMFGCVLMVPSVRFAEAEYLHKRQRAEYLASPTGRATLERYHRVLRLAEQPELQLLTDSGVVALRQRERAPFVDPWLFRMLVHTGRIDPVVLEQRVRSQVYDHLVLMWDLYDPRSPYENYAFGLPAPLVRAARGRYELASYEAGFFIYRPVRVDRGNQ